MREPSFISQLVLNRFSVFVLYVPVPDTCVNVPLGGQDTKRLRESVPQLVSKEVNTLT